MTEFPTIIRNCIECPEWNNCEEIKKLNGAQKFTMETLPNLRGVLKTCPLIGEDIYKQTLVKIKKLLDDKNTKNNLNLLEFTIHDICFQILKK